MRGFVLTADDTYLEPYRTGRQQATAAEAKIRSNLGDPVVTDRVIAMAKAVDQWRSLSVEPLMARTRQGGAPAVTNEDLARTKGRFVNVRGRYQDLASTIDGIRSRSRDGLDRRVRVLTVTDAVHPIEVLLVEDDPGDVLMTKEALAESKVLNSLHVVSDGEEALAFLRREGIHADAPRPGLILLDLNLPRVDGREVLAAVKSDPDLRRIPVVVLTTSQAEEDILRSYDLHANAFVTKPVDFDRFLEVIRQIDSFYISVVKLPST